MPITIDELNTKYGEADENWKFKSFFTWLTKKGIPSTVVQAALKQTLTDFSPETLPKDHYTFDNTVLLLAKVLQEKLEETMVRELEDSLTDKLKNYEEDWNKLKKWQKYWEVFRGRA